MKAICNKVNRIIPQDKMLVKPEGLCGFLSVAENRFGDGQDIGEILTFGYVGSNLGYVVLPPPILPLSVIPTVSYLLFPKPPKQII
jgi:hypothetical protein